MFDFYEKRKIRSYVYSKLSITVVLLIAVFFGVSTYERFTVEREMHERRQMKEVELEALEARASALEEKVEHFENARGIEEELRNRFDVAKEGEQVIIIVDDGKGTETDLETLAKPPGENNEKKNFLLDFLKFW